MSIFSAIKDKVTDLGSSLTQKLGLDDDPGTSSAPVPVPSSPPAPTPATVPAPASPGDVKNGEPVEGTFVPVGQAASELYTSSIAQTERFQNLIETFDEDKQEWIEWAIRKLAALFCYVAPFVLAVPIGWAIGDVFTPDKATWMMGIAIHLLSVFLEIVMPILGLSTAISFKRALKDKHQWVGAIIVASIFVLVSVLNALALLFLLEKNGLDTTNLAQSVAVLGRSFGSFIIDLACTIYLTVHHVKSLQKYLADQRAKIVATRDVNQVNIEMEQAQIRAAIERENAMMDMESKRKRAETWNTIEGLQAETMIEQAKSAFESNRNGSIRRGGGW